MTKYLRSGLILALLVFLKTLRRPIQSQKSWQRLSRQSLRLSPRRRQAHQELSARALSWNRHYNVAIRLDPNSADAFINRGTAYAEQGNRDKADADFATTKRLKAGQ
jgi:hypothetical protein